MPTITVTVDDGLVATGASTVLLRFKPRGVFFDGDTIVPAIRSLSVSCTLDTPTAVQLRPGPWEVYGLANVPIPLDVGAADSTLKALIDANVTVPADTPQARLTEIVEAWLAEHAPSATGVEWADVTDKPSTFTPAAHGHAVGDVTGLQGQLDGKSPAGHTHTPSQITDLTEYIQDAVDALIQAGANVTKSYDDANGVLTISATGGGTGGGTDAEVVRDTIAGALVAGAGVNIAVDDAADTITIAVAGVPMSAVSGLDTALAGKSPTGHTHAVADVSGLQSALDGKAASSHAHTASQVSDATPVGRLVMTATDAAAARTAIGAGTSSLALGSTSTTAAAGNHTHAGYATLTGAETLTNKRIQPRVGTVASSATPAISTDTVDVFTITALAAAITSMSSGLTGTPVEGQRIVLRIKDNGTARAIAWGASWRAVGVTLPTTTVANKTTYVGAAYNAADSVWDVLAVGTQA